MILALAWPDARGTLLDSRQTSCAALQAAVAELHLGSRIDVACGRAEALARDPASRERYDLVVARSFAPPAVTAESAVGFLAPTGKLVVTEPPTPDAARWPADHLARLGLGEATPGPGYVEIPRSGAPVDAWPRTRPGKAPLW